MSDIMSFSPLWGEWHIKDLIGKGSFGAVYKAEKTEYGNTYTSAVKHISIPNESMNAESLISEGVVSDEKSVLVYYDAVRDKMIKEINFCYALRGNTNIVSYEDHCIIPKKDGVGYDIFIRMEHLTALPKYMREHEFGEKQVIQLGIDICSALEVLDKHNIIHRDIKPANIFVNSVGVYKLGDFGESKVLSNTNVGMTVRGTYTYMSPEISMGRSADITADIYSLGIVMYRLLNGNKPPFVPVDMSAVDSQTVEAANIRRFRGEKLPLPQFCADKGLAAVIMKACEFSPADRWKKPIQMKKALEALLEQERPAAAPAGVPAQPKQTAPATQKKGGKMKIIIPIIAALLVAAAVVTVIMINSNKPKESGGDNGSEPSAVTQHSPEGSDVSRTSVQPQESGKDGESSAESSAESPSQPAELVSLKITAGPEKTEYSIGEEFSAEGMVTEAVYSDGSRGELPLADCEISGFDSSKAGQCTVTISCKGKTAELTVEIKEGSGEYLSSGSCGSSAEYTVSRDGVLSIKGSGDMDDYSLGYVVLEDNTVAVRSTCPWAENKDEITKVTIAEGVTSVGSYAFYELSHLTDAQLPAGLKTIGAGSFRGCLSLERLGIPAGTELIGDEAFVNCKSLKALDVDGANSTYSSEGGVLYSKDRTSLIKCPEAVQGSVTVSSGTTTIGSWAFDNCAGVTEIILPDGLKTIEKYAFSGCRGVAFIEIPSSVTVIESAAFRYWQSSQQISFPGVSVQPDTWDRGWSSDCRAEILWYGAFG